MNIHHLRYFVAIVDHNYNISQAAQTLFISQPALSKALISLETEIKLELFERSRGRLCRLNSHGQMFYTHTKKIIDAYNELESKIESSVQSSQGEITLGIPPLVITALFPDFLREIKLSFPNLNLHIREQGGKQLEDALLSNQLDFSVLVVDDESQFIDFNIVPIHLGEYAIFLAKDHPLNQLKKIEWLDLQGKDISICDDTFKTYHIFFDTINRKGIVPHSVLTSPSWDYLFATIRNTKNVTFLPIASKSIFNMKGVNMLTFKEPLQWKISLVYRKKEQYTNSEKNLIRFTQVFFEKRTLK